MGQHICRYFYPTGTQAFEVRGMGMEPYASERGTFMRLRKYEMNI